MNYHQFTADEGRRGNALSRQMARRNAEQFLDEYRWLRGQGCSIKEIAERNGVQRDSLLARLRRAKVNPATGEVLP